MQVWACDDYNGPTNLPMRCSGGDPGHPLGLVLGGTFPITRLVGDLGQGRRAEVLDLN